MLTDLASIQGVSLPTMSNSISMMVEHGWVRRAAEGDPRVVMIEVTPAGRSALERVARCAEAHLAEVLAPLDLTARRQLQSGLGVLRGLRHQQRRLQRPPKEQAVTSCVYYWRLT
jgi:DNA-binding MarR family transcriptional regulator